MEFKDLGALLKNGPNNEDNLHLKIMYDEAITAIVAEQEKLPTITNIIEYRNIVDNISNIEKTAISYIMSYDFKCIDSYTDVYYNKKNIELYSFLDISYERPKKIAYSGSETLECNLISKKCLNKYFLVVKFDSKCVIINKDFNFIESDNITKISYRILEDRCFMVVSKGNLYGVIDQDINMLIDYCFKSITVSNGDYIIVQCTNRLFGYYTFDGDVLFDCIFLHCEGFKNGRAVVSLLVPNVGNPTSEKYVIDIHGNFINKK